jgi:hypothetical protein
LLGVWVLLSLAGGPSAFLFDVVPSFRCYGRTGLLMVGVWSVVTPVTLAWLANRLGRPALGLAVLVGAAALAGYDAYQAQKLYFRYQGPPRSRPEWVNWLRDQPVNVHFALFPSEKEQIGFDFLSLGYLTEHGHATLNGGEEFALNADLALVGASYRQMNADGLRFIASLGYDTMAFHPDFLAAHRWVRSLDWLESAGTAGEWEMYRVSSRLSRPRNCWRRNRGRPSRSSCRAGPGSPGRWKCGRNQCWPCRGRCSWPGPARTAAGSASRCRRCCTTWSAPACPLTPSRRRPSRASTN